ncbi:MAG: hypothetical protein II684_02300 [Treponema sp.]|nr:hypothetical protein [Treponema sp.]MBR4464287.1 hypothetical protein [Treponema sp.]
MKKSTALIAILFSLCLTPLFAEYNRLNVPDSTIIRRAVADKWFEAPLSELRGFRSEIRTNEIGERFQVRLEETAFQYAIIVAPEIQMKVDYYTEKGMESRLVAEYPGDACGSWILYCDSSTGKATKIRWYITQNSDVYIQFTPDRNKTLGDFVIDNCYASRSVPVGILFNQLYTASFANVLQITENSFPWRYAEIHFGDYLPKMQMISIIRKNLSHISYAEDAAYDENGKPVRISDGHSRMVDASERENNMLSLSSAGFVKWIVDGLIEPVSGSGTFMKPLVQPTMIYDPLSYAGMKDESEGVSFMLDWTRNLAAARFSVQTHRNYRYEESGVDVSIEPFSSEMTDKGIMQTAGYIRNSGYAISRLRPVLYVLGVTEPTYCYLAAIRRRYVSVNGTAPELYKFDQTAVIFPYFDKNGRFAITVFENGTEVPYNTFVSKYKNSFVHLTRVLASEKFFPLGADAKEVPVERPR